MQISADTSSRVDHDRTFAARRRAAMFRALTPFTRRTEPAGSTDAYGFFQREMNRLFDDAFRGLPMAPGPGNGFHAPSIDVKETEKAIEIEAELPGMSEKDIEVRLESDLLTIKGEKRQEKEESKKDYHVSERSYGSFLRTVQVPSGVDVSKVTATYEKGVLKVTMPKPTDTKSAAKKIDVKAA
jgi:HSP20 family protein